MHVLVAVGAVWACVCALCPHPWGPCDLSLHAFLCLGRSRPALPALQAPGLSTGKRRLRGAGPALHLWSQGHIAFLCISLFFQPHLWVSLPGVLPHLVLNK